MDEALPFSVEVLLALPDRTFRARVTLEPGATVADAIKFSGLLDSYPQAGQPSLVAGIFGRRVALSARLQRGDRIEIYRPLRADPKQLRLNRARSG